jgi:hypothetical protein
MSGITSLPISSPEALALIVERGDSFLTMLRESGRVDGLPGMPLAEAAQYRRHGLFFAWREFEEALSGLRDGGGVQVLWDCRPETLDALVDLVVIRRSLRELWPLPPGRLLPDDKGDDKGIAFALPPDWPPPVPAHLWEQARLDLSRLRGEMAAFDAALISSTARVANAAASVTSPAPPPTGCPECGELPTMLSAADLAKVLNQPVDPLDSFLRRLREKLPDCYQETDSPRKNEPRFLYRVADVWPDVQRWLKHRT